MSRLKAATIHFTISFSIFLIFLYFILIQWYPKPLFSTDGGWQVIKIIVGVDLILGPLLTLIVFKAGKPGLKFDLTMIAFIQILALSWGGYNTYNERPAALIYTFDFFTPVPAYQLEEQGITAEKLKEFGDGWPVLIYIDVPKEKVSSALGESMRAGKPLYLFSKYYSSLGKEQAHVLKENSMDLEKYVEDKPKLKTLYQHSLAARPTNANISYLALHSREKWVTAVFDIDSMKVIDTIDIEPSAYTYAQKVNRKKTSDNK